MGFEVHVGPDGGKCRFLGVESRKVQQLGRKRKWCCCCCCSNYLPAVKQSCKANFLFCVISCSELLEPQIIHTIPWSLSFSFLFLFFIFPELGSCLAASLNLEYARWSSAMVLNLGVSELPWEQMQPYINIV